MWAGRWRGVAFGSPHRLNLRIACTAKSSVRDKLYVWPRLPIIVSGDCNTVISVDNIKAGLEHNNRANASEGYFAALEKSFPVLTDFRPVIATVASNSAVG
jgi:hypothetical protein